MEKNQSNTQKSKITYKVSGVDIDEGNKLVSEISNITQSTSNEGSTAELGGFGFIRFKKMWFQ